MVHPRAARKGRVRSCWCLWSPGAASASPCCCQTLIPNYLCTWTKPSCSHASAELQKAGAVAQGVSCLGSCTVTSPVMGYELGMEPGKRWDLICSMSLL